MTLSFSWATNANYSTGPNTGTPTKVDPASTANGFVNGTIAAAQHINFLFDAVGDQIVQAVDGVGGGTYTLGSALRFQGADVEINAGLEILAAGELNVQNGGELNILGTLGLVIEAAGSASVEGTVFVGGGGSVGIVTGGSLIVDTSEQLTINDSPENWLLTLAPHSLSFDAGTLAPTWLPLPSAAGWFQHDVSSARQICFPLTLPPGDSIVTCVVRANGAGAGAGHSSLPAGADRLLVKIVRVEFDGAVTVEASRADQSANVGAYDISHVITLASGSLDSGALPILVNATDRYYVVIEGEKGANAVADTTTITEVKGTCTARSYRASTMVY